MMRREFVYGSEKVSTGSMDGVLLDSHQACRLCCDDGKTLVLLEG
jgi:hypothetical protein